MWWYKDITEIIYDFGVGTYFKSIGKEEWLTRLIIPYYDMMAGGI